MFIEHFDDIHDGWRRHQTSKSETTKNKHCGSRIVVPVLEFSNKIQKSENQFFQLELKYVMYVLDCCLIC